LVEIWQTIKNDRKRHMHLLKEALEKEIHGWVVVVGCQFQGTDRIAADSIPLY
jgi:hypothetical protein